MSASEKRKLFEYLGDPEVRYLYVDSTIRQLLALKIKTLRDARGFDQETLGQLAGGMKQSSISRLQDPSYAKMTLKTLKRLAKAFDVALLVDFVAFSELVDRTIDRTEADFAPPSYDEERHLGGFRIDIGSGYWSAVVTNAADIQIAPDLPSTARVYVPSGYGEVYEEQKSSEPKPDFALA